MLACDVVVVCVLLDGFGRCATPSTASRFCMYVFFIHHMFFIIKCKIFYMKSEISLDVFSSVRVCLRRRIVRVSALFGWFCDVRRFLYDVS